jgi:hypothetical protein
LSGEPSGGPSAGGGATGVFSVAVLGCPEADLS